MQYMGTLKRTQQSRFEGQLTNASQLQNDSNKRASDTQEPAGSSITEKNETTT